MRKPIIVLAAVLAVLSFGCRQETAEMNTDTMTTTEPITTDTGAIEREVSQVRDQWIAAAEKDDAATVAMLYTEDAVFDSPDTATAVQGRQAVQEHFAKLFPASSDLQIRSTDFKAGADLAYDYGEFTQRITPPKRKPVEQSGRYLVVLERQDDGWKIAKHVSFPVTAASQAASAPRR